jgi:hypothetical protein
VETLLSPLGGYLGHDALLPFFTTSQKKSLDIYVVTDHTSERFFGGRLDLARSKGDGMCGARCCCSFKVPSTYTYAATVRRLAGTDRVFRPSSDLFSKMPEQLLRLWSIMIFMTNHTSYFSNSSKFSVAANVWHPLAIREGRASRLLRPCGSRVELGHLEFQRPTTHYSGQPWALGSVQAVTLFEQVLDNMTLFHGVAHMNCS